MKRVAAALVSAFASALALLAAQPAAAAPSPARDVLEGEVVYHIFQRSFRDSNGDGHGDLEGVRQSLAYLETLGVTAVLMTPLYPGRTYHNYFATDFEGIDPRYGTRADLQRLITEAHARGIKIFLDMEFQYLAAGHPWWTAAMADRTSPYNDWMLWDDRAAGIAEEGPFGLREIRHFNRDSHGVTTVALRVSGDERLVIVANLTGAPADVPALAGDGPDLFSGERKPLRAWRTALYRPAR